MNWLDDYIFNHDDGYFMNLDGSLWVQIDEDHVRHAAHNNPLDDMDGLIEISKDEFIESLLK